MKKLMIAAAIVCAAVITQAASLDWTISSKAFLMSDGSTKPNGTTVYLMDTKAATWDAFATILADGGDYANLAAVLAGSEFTGAKVDQAATYSSTTQAKVNNYYGQVKDGKATISSAGVSSDYAILVTDGEKYLISMATEGKSYAEDPNDGVAASFVAASFTADNSLSGGWQKYEASAVPEPTSGLLLLLGVAGLALRRRRA